MSSDEGPPGRPVASGSRPAMARQDIGQIIYSYVKPLSDKFPNHEIEVQLDLHGPLRQRVQHKFARRKPYLHKPYMFAREGTKGKSDAPKPKPAVPAAAPTAASSHPPTAHPPSSVKTLHHKLAAKIESPKQPIYKEEMQKALDDLEKKLMAKKVALKGSYDGPQESAHVIVSNPGPVNGSAGGENINSIIELLKKGVHLQRHLPIAGDDGNMEWMQIKIPKN